MKNNYDYCLREVLKSEGGYTNDPNDKGGPTNFGITLADYRLYINKAGTAEDVQKMSLDQAKSIYRAKYWGAMKCDDLPSGLDYTVFDYGVNSGIKRAISVNNQYATITDPIKRINAINDERLHFLHNIRNGTDWVHFGRGWNARVARVRADSIKLATSKAPSIGGAVATGGAAAAGAANSYGQFFAHHWLAIGLTATAVGLLTYILINAYRTKVSNV